MAQSAISGVDLVNQLTPTDVIVDLRLPCPSGLAAMPSSTDGTPARCRNELPAP